MSISLNMQGTYRNNKNSEYLLASTVNNDKCFRPHKFEDGEFILA